VAGSNAIQYGSIGTSGTGFLNVNITWPATTTANSLLVAVVMGKCASNPPISAAPSGWTSTLVQNQGTTSVQIYFKTAAAAQSSTGNFQIGNAGQAGDVQVLAAEYHPGGGGGLDKQAQAAGTSGSPATGSTGTLSQSAETIIAGMLASVVGTFTSPTNGFKIGVQRSQGAISGALLDKIVSATTTQSTAATLSSTAWCTSIITQKT
jgi:hypothetical protein